MIIGMKYTDFFFINRASIIGYNTFQARDICLASYILGFEVYESMTSTYLSLILFLGFEDLTSRPL